MSTSQKAKGEGMNSVKMVDRLNMRKVVEKSGDSNNTKGNSSEPYRGQKK